MIGICTGMVALGLVTGAPAGATTATTEGDTVPPSVPQNLHTAPAFTGDETVRWDASTDNSGTIWNYWVIVDGVQKARPVSTSYDLHTLVYLCRIAAGRHSVTVQAVDHSFNRSGQSNALVLDIR